MLAPPGFRDLSLIGTGATSRVYRAIDAKTNRAVALKRLHRQLAKDSEALSRLKRELESLGRLRHPAIVEVRDVIRWQGDPTVVMDYIPGVDLKEEIKKRGGALHAKEIEHIARVLFDVLQAAHSAGIVHRDVKPQNVRIGENGGIYLLDFGSARLDAASQLTATGTTVGTPEYMAPELFAGSVYDPRVDIYGAGATLFECATGRAPQLAESLTELAFKRTKEDVLPVASLSTNLPDALAQVIDRCLARAPEDRYSAASLATWALDHPEVEKRFRARRSSAPPCLHCGAPVAPESTVCASCGSDHPFYYAPGSAHVVLRSVRDPSVFAAEMVARFPERANERDLYAMSERIAALGRSRQRLLSFIDREEAAKLVEELAVSGAECELVEDEGGSNWRSKTFMLFALFAAMFVGLCIGIAIDIPFLALPLFIVPSALLYAFFRARTVVDSERGLLSDGNLPTPAIAGASTALGAISALLYSASEALPAMSAALESAHYHTALVWTFAASRPALSIGALAFAAASVFAATRNLRSGTRPKAGSPEPNVWMKLRRAFSERTSELMKPVSEGTIILLTTLVLALVPMELGGLSILRTIDSSGTWMFVMQETARMQAIADSITEMIESPVIDPAREIIREPITADMITPDAIGRPIELTPKLKALRERAQQQLEPAELERLVDELNAELRARHPPPVVRAKFQWTKENILTASAGGLLAFGALITALWIALRRRAITREAKTIYPALKNLLDGSRKLAPGSRRIDIMTTDADRLVHEIEANNAFMREARRRAVELAHHLPREETSRLRHALELLGKKGPQTATDRSLVARCIAETDPEQHLRFELLALEGQLEAIAATSWAERVRDAEEEP